MFGKVNENIIEKYSTIISPQVAFEKNILILGVSNGTLKIAIPNISNPKLVNDLGFETGYKIEAIEYPAEKILTELRRMYPGNEVKTNSNTEKNGNSITDYTNIEFVNEVIENAVKNRASDIHFESREKSFSVRFRVDGYLKEVYCLPKEKSFAVSNRIKIMANLDIAEKRRPQDGRIKITVQGRKIDIRVSTLPTNFGEKIVLRILDKAQLNLDLNKLGLSEIQYNLLIEKINSPYGMILVTGPTGSGKTTTLYASLQTINSSDKNIITVEDPIEYNLDGINQCNVKSEIGFDFANALRAFLRQDPDIIMVGEIRDRETADIGIRAALTGHLVFSTLHTNDSLTCITRLIDMGIESYLVSSSVKLIVAQRLVRKLCKCKEQSAIKLPDSITGGLPHYENRGCEKCNFTGYIGRTAIYEMLDINEELQKCIANNPDISEIKNIALKNGFSPLSAAGIEKIRNGITTYEEILRETML